MRLQLKLLSVSDLIAPLLTHSPDDTKAILLHWNDWDFPRLRIIKYFSIDAFMGS